MFRVAWLGIANVSHASRGEIVPLGWGRGRGPPPAHAWRAPETLETDKQGGEAILHVEP